jgi:MYXO-CTERM domain-containing protein
MSRRVALAVFAIAGSARAADISATPSTLDALVPTLKGGDTLHLAAGHYNHFSVTNLNGASTAWITITSDTPQAAIIDADSVPCCNTIQISGSSYVAIQNLLVDGHDVDGAFGVAASDGSGPTHDIRIEGNAFVHHHGSQQHDAISTKTPTWGWVIKNNTISDAGTGLYLGNSTGDDPFIGGLIEGNTVTNPIGYCMEIKFQNPRPTTIAGMPTAPTSTIIRKNVFIKNDDPSPDGDRPNLLVGGFPATGAGSQDRYEVYGNVFAHNPRESLFQASGRVTIHDNVFVDAPATRALLLQDHDLPLELAYVYDNTIYDVGSGIVFGNSAPQGDGVAGNLIFSPNPSTGPIADHRDDMTDTVANASMYVVAPSDSPSAFDFHPLAGKCTGAPVDESKFASDTDYAIDFDSKSKGTFTYRGAFAGGAASPKDAGPSSDAGGADAGGVGPPGSSGCGCREAPTHERGVAAFAALVLAMLARRRRRSIS